MKEVLILVLLTLFVNFCDTIILMPNNNRRFALDNRRAERNLLSLFNSQSKNQQFEYARFQKIMGNYMYSLGQKQITNKQFLQNMDDEDRDVQDKLISAKRHIKSMKDDSLNQLDGIMTTLGIGLS